MMLLMMLDKYKVEFLQFYIAMNNNSWILNAVPSQMYFLGNDRKVKIIRKFEIIKFTNNKFEIINFGRDFCFSYDKTNCEGWRSGIGMVLSMAQA